MVVCAATCRSMPMARASEVERCGYAVTTATRAVRSERESAPRSSAAVVAAPSSFLPFAAGMTKTVPFAVRKDYLAKNRDAVIRWSMAYLQGVKEFNAAAKDPAKHPEIIEILANNTALNKPELVRAIAPNWGYINEDGAPAVDSIMGMQDFWSGKYFSFVEKKVTQEQLFDLSVAKEAMARLDREKPFGP